MINLFFTSFFRNKCYLKFLLIFRLRDNSSFSFSAILSKLFTCKNIIAIYGNNLETTLLEPQKTKERKLNYGIRHIDIE